MVASVTATVQGPELLSVSEAAALLHVHPNTLRRWGAQGLLQAYRLGSRGDRRFSRADLLRLLVSETNGR